MVRRAEKFTPKGGYLRHGTCFLKVEKSWNWSFAVRFCGLSF